MFNTAEMTWSPSALPCRITSDRVEMTTLPRTDLWQRTFGHGGVDNAPVLQAETREKHFTFTTKVTFEGRVQYDQAGLVMHLGADTWFKASMELEDEHIRHLGSVVTNHGYSDWATVEVPASVTVMWYRMTRQGSDFLLECSADGKKYSLMRMFHMWNCDDLIRFGLYACSPGDSSFTAVFEELDFKA